MKWKISYIIFLAIILHMSCSKDDDNECDTKGITYNGIINSIIEESCNNGSCHPGLNGGWQVLADFSTYDNLLTNLENGEIEFRINTEDSILRMPLLTQPDRTITQNDLDLLNAWICNGFPEN